MVSRTAGQLQELFENQRTSLLRDAFEDAKRWCVLPEAFIAGKHSDQFWLQVFSSPEERITAKEVHDFLVGFQLTICVEWDKERVAAKINEYRKQKISAIEIAISDLSNDLTNCIRSKNRGQQTSAASKITFFAKPREEVFIWDKFASCSARFRDWRRSGEQKRLSLNRLYILPNGKHDYAAFWNSARQVLEEESSRKDFLGAAKQFRKYLKQAGGPMSNREVIESSFVERRLLDKLMYWEGVWLKKESRNA